MITDYHTERIDTSLLNRDFQLADPDAGNRSQIDILLGSEYYYEFLQTKGQGTVSDESSSTVPPRTHSTVKCTSTIAHFINL